MTKNWHPTRRFNVNEMALILVCALLTMIFPWRNIGSFNDAPTAGMKQAVNNKKKA